MKTSRFSEEQIIATLRAADSGQTVADVCRERGISTPTFYQWRKKYGGMDVGEARRLRALEAENARLKRLVADQALALDVMKEINSKNWAGHK